jgi:hypothetical protein
MTLSLFNDEVLSLEKDLVQARSSYAASPWL